MTDIETVMEMKLIETLTQGESQWVYRDDLKTEDALWANFKKILENNNLNKLNGKPLTDTEFSRIQNQIVSPTFYEAGVKLIGENGVVHVQIERDEGTVLLNVFDRSQKSGGSSVYEIINQCQRKGDGETRNRRYDVSFLFNGMPLIHLELKNGHNASYMEAFNQIQTYINEGKFKGIFSLIQIFIVSNEVQTKYIAANENLNKTFLTSWTKKDDPEQSVSNLFDFAKEFLTIPMAHEMVTDYCQLDSKAKRLIILRPFQIHAILAMKDDYLHQKSSYFFGHPGCGKTILSYKCARNLLSDVPSIDKTIFLIDRKDLDDKTCTDFESYAESDTIDVIGTENTYNLERKLLSEKRQMIVTTIQKLQRVIRNCEDDEAKAKKLQNKHVAFIVDECHRTVTRPTQLLISSFFKYPLWYGFTGTPIYVENQGMLQATTETMYGKPSSSYTIKNALHDNAVLGFQVERLGPQGLSDTDEENLAIYNTQEHMNSVVDVILNSSEAKFGLSLGSGKTFEAILTTGSIKKAQKYYNLIQDVKNGVNKDVAIKSEIKSLYPDFPKVAITYSYTENLEESENNKNEIQKAIDDYNKMFDTSFKLDTIDAYNADLTNRFARKGEKYLARGQQLDMVIVAERLLTGFDAPCLSTIFLDRQPMPSHKIIQALSRTNRVFNNTKTKGFVVTFQAPGQFKKAIDEAIELFSKGGTGSVLAPTFDEAEANLRNAILRIRSMAQTPNDCANFGEDKKRKKLYCLTFQSLDSALGAIRCYIEWLTKSLEKDYGLSEDELNAYEAWYRNFIDELKTDRDDKDEDPDGTLEDYELQCYGKENIDYTYVVRLIQAFVSSQSVSVEEVEKNIEAISQTSPRLGEELNKLWQQVKNNPEEFVDKDLMVIFEEMKNSTIKRVFTNLAETYCLNLASIEYSSFYYRGNPGEDIPNFAQIKLGADIKSYVEKTGKPIIPIMYFDLIRTKIKEVFDDYVVPFTNINF